MSNAKRVLLWPDTHIPDHDKRKVSVMLKIVKEWQPDRLVFLGDLDDMSAPSRFASGTPEEWKSRLSQTTETETKKFLEDVRSILPDAEIDYFEGNHEARLKGYIEKKAPALDGLVSVPKILDLDNLGIKWYPYQDAPSRVVGDYYVHHGSFVSKYPGQSAQKELEHYGVSGFSGHTHRIGEFHKAMLDGRTLHWYECGHLSDVSKMNYSQHYNWQHGFGYAYVDGKKVFPFTAKFINNTVMIDGQKFSG